MLDAALTCPHRSFQERIQRSVTRSLLKTFEKAPKAQHEEDLKAGKISAEDEEWLDRLGLLQCPMTRAASTLGRARSAG